MISVICYRFVVCPLETYDENEQWCFNVGEDYPMTLLSVPASVVPPLESTVPVGKATTVFVSHVLTTVMATIACTLLL